MLVLLLTGIGITFDQGGMVISAIATFRDRAQFDGSIGVGNANCHSLETARTYRWW